MQIKVRNAVLKRICGRWEGEKIGEMHKKRKSFLEEVKYKGIAKDVPDVI